MAEMIVIEHPDGRSYAVLPADFEKGIDGDYKGFKIIHWEGGASFEGPKTAAAIAKASGKSDASATKDEPAKSEG